MELATLSFFELGVGHLFLTAFEIIRGASSRKSLSKLSFLLVSYRVRTYGSRPISDVNE